MIKVYKCVSEISFNLKINGNKRRINFEPMSGGKSQYRTNDRDVQEGIEKLDQFGSVIHVAEVIKEESDLLEKGGKLKGKKLAEGDSSGAGGGNPNTEENGGSGSNGGEEKKADEGGGETDIQEKITSFAEAKEYLITKGCEKTIRSKENILAYAQELGVEFPNLK